MNKNMNKNIIVIGGSKKFNDFKLGADSIDAIIKKNKISKKDLIVYGYADGYVGAFTVAKVWTENNKVKFEDGSPKKGNDWNKQLIERNEALSSISKLLINLKVGHENGGKTLIKSFEDKGVNIETVDLETGKVEPVNKVKPSTDPNATPSEKRKGEVPESSKVSRSIKIYSEVAQKLLNYGCLMVDTESTGVGEKDGVIELAIADCVTETPLFDSLIYSDVPINPEAFKVNNITTEMLKGAPSIEKIWNRVEATVGNRVMLASNSPFDERLLNQSLEEHGLVCSFIWMDIQTLYRSYSCQKDARMYPLKTSGMCQQLGIEPGTHRAMTDVMAQIKILKAMAQGIVPDFTV